MKVSSDLFSIMKGSFSDLYYVRTMPNGQMLLCKKPAKTNRKPSEAELENRRRFIEKYATKGKGSRTNK